MIGDLENDTAIVRYTRAHAEELRARLEEIDGGVHIIRTELFGYAREIGVMVAHKEQPGWQDFRFRDRQYDVDKLAEEIMGDVE